MAAITQHPTAKNESFANSSQIRVDNSWSSTNISGYRNE
jgi:hypothetical protein